MKPESRGIKVVNGLPENATAIRVLLMTPHDLILQGLSSVLQLEHGIEVVAGAKESQDAFAKARSLQPDVVLLHTFAPDADGLAATRRLKEEFPQTRVLVLNQRADQGHFQRAIAAGASGYELMDISPSHLANTIRAVYSGKMAINHTMLKEMAETLAGNGHGPSSASPQPHNLTVRGVQVLTKLAQGLSDKEIAAQLLLSEATVKSHLRIIYAKLRIHNRAQAAAYAVQRGLVPPLHSS